MCDCVCTLTRVHIATHAYSHVHVYIHIYIHMRVLTKWDSISWEMKAFVGGPYIHMYTWIGLCLRMCIDVYAYWDMCILFEIAWGLLSLHASMGFLACFFHGLYTFLPRCWHSSCTADNNCTRGRQMSFFTCASVGPYVSNQITLGEFMYTVCESFM